MHTQPRPHLAAALLTLALGACGGPTSAVEPESGLPWELRASGWRTDPVWYDGRAEKAVYAASRTIYGVDRGYEATVYTNKQLMDEDTSTKAGGGREQAGVEVFKQHLCERAPTENYDYDFSTCTFTVSASLAPFKLTAATQEDCGASFKQLWREPDAPGRMRWFESVYFPDAGVREGSLSLAGRRALHFADALPLVLRDYPFDRPPEELTLDLVPSQASTRRRPFEPAPHRVRYVGRETLSLELGEVDAHRLSVEPLDGGDAEAATELWFAAEGGVPWLHVLLQLEGEGLRYRLRSFERSAYWER